MSVQTADAGLESGLWRGRRRVLRRNLTAFLFLLPTFLFLAIFMYQPTVNVIYHTLFRWDGFTVERFVGFKNFITMVKRPQHARRHAQSRLVLPRLDVAAHLALPGGGAGLQPEAGTHQILVPHAFRVADGGAVFWSRS